MPCKCVQTSKVPLAGKLGAFQYTFKCKTSDGRTKKATLVESDNKRAKRLAELKCDQVTSRE
jgi:hypothetical protein